LQIVESRREGDQVRQQVVATLGRFEDLRASGQLERLLGSGARFAAKAMTLVFERLWEETGCRAVIPSIGPSSTNGAVTPS
jgi:hypothetical protein